MDPTLATFLRCECASSAGAIALDRMGAPVLVKVGEATVASVQVAIVEGTAGAWVGELKRSAAPGGPFVSFSPAETFSSSGVSAAPLDVADDEYLGFFVTTPNVAALKVDVRIRLSAP